LKIASEQQWHGGRTLPHYSKVEGFRLTDAGTKRVIAGKNLMFPSSDFHFKNDIKKF
jgi:hypothetical protein